MTTRRPDAEKANERKAPIKAMAKAKSLLKNPARGIMNAENKSVTGIRTGR
jgi:hypothetical protein